MMEANLGTMVGRALVRGGHGPALVEFRRGEDWEDWTSPSKIYGPLSSGANAGLGGKLIEQAAMGGRLARDLSDYVSSRSRRAPSAEVANFKLTPSSPNTARITVGEDRRDRRKKYEWERVGTQRKIQKVALALGAPALLAAGGYLHHKGGGSVLRGIGAVSKAGYHKTRDIVSAVVTAARGKKPRVSSGGSSQARANAVVKAATERAEAAKAAKKDTPTPGSPIHVVFKIPGEKK
jgi:hypothetical protein